MIDFATVPGRQRNIHMLRCARDKQLTNISRRRLAAVRGMSAPPENRSRSRFIKIKLSRLVVIAAVDLRPDGLQRQHQRLGGIKPAYFHFVLFAWPVNFIATKPRAILRLLRSENSDRNSDWIVSIQQREYPTRDQHGSASVVYWRHVSADQTLGVTEVGLSPATRGSHCITDKRVLPKLLFALSTTLRRDSPRNLCRRLSRFSRRRDIRYRLSTSPPPSLVHCPPSWLPAGTRGWSGLYLRSTLS